jgi:NAD(P)-dependent dehydrogenase (short-subunit alcohol dehydrogenase family)|tara:strand:- start:52974 stop:53834 length:861 start_codon:yes stop_codon:yes gene_type:complete
MLSLNGRTIALTGAGSGIGRALAVAMARKGATVALADRDAEGLAYTSRMLGDYPHSTRLFDVTDHGVLEAWIDEVAAEFGALHGIINNAGLSVIAPFEHMPAADFDCVMDVNFNAVVRGCRAALPHVKATDGGWIVNISSVFGLMGYPTQSAYNASKFAVRGLSEAMHLELGMTAPHVRVVRVHPGGIKTRVAHNAKFIRGIEGAGDQSAPGGMHDPDGFVAASPTSPEAAADAIIRGMETGAHRILIGRDARMVDWLTRLMPVNYWRRIGPFLGAKAASNRKVTS